MGSGPLPFLGKVSDKKLLFTSIDYLSHEYDKLYNNDMLTYDLRTPEKINMICEFLLFWYKNIKSEFLFVALNISDSFDTNE